MSVAYDAYPGNGPDALVAAAYAEQFSRFGESHTGVLWSSAKAQRRHFAQLARIFRGNRLTGGFSINDLGCGYGAFFDYLVDEAGIAVSRYTGYDLCADMIAAARRRRPDPRACFLLASAACETADYSFASGTFNLKATATDAHWSSYVKQALLALWRQSARGLAFNLLDAARAEAPQPWLFYADADEFTAFCRAQMSAKVTRLSPAGDTSVTWLLRR